MEGASPQLGRVLGGRNRAFRFGALLIAVAGTAALIAACGGGGTTDDGTDPVAETEQKQALGLFDKLPTSWAPSKLVFDLNPGGKQGVPITLTTTKALTNVRIVFVPDLRNAVIVSPETIASLDAGQRVTVTLSFQPGTAENRKYLAGVVLAFSKDAAISRPLPVKVSLVKPETINGVVVPPEPSPDLNNATLAGFDANGNGVRDDIDRLIATRFGGKADAQYAAAFAREYQSTLVGPPPVDRAAALTQAGRQSCAARGATDSMRTFGWGSAIVNTEMRRQALQKFNDALEGYIHRELPPCAN